MIIGTPFTAFNQNEYEGLTLWEQIDGGQQFTPTKKYLTALPILLYVLFFNLNSLDHHHWQLQSHVNLKTSLFPTLYPYNPYGQNNNPLLGFYYPLIILITIYPHLQSILQVCSLS